MAKAGWIFTAAWLGLRAAGHAGLLIPTLVTAVVVALTYFFFDRPFLTGRTAVTRQNVMASTAEGILAGVALWWAAGLLPEPGVGFVPLILVGLGVALGEWFVHLALRGPKPVSERSNRPPGVNDDQ
ncbi:MAG: hypothetical protein WD535_02650 [Thermaerobacterales bacterium]